MAKIPYLIGTGADRKLKRNVPLELRSLANKWAWVERLRGKTADEIKRQQQVFALWTSAEISLLRRQKERRVQVAEGPITLRLDETTAKELALLYFREMDDLNMREGAYAVDPDDPAYQDILEDATAEYITAKAAMTHVEIGASRTVVRLLVDRGFLPLNLPQDGNGNYRLPAEIGKLASFQFLCRCIERADLELTNRRCHALYKGTIPPIGDNLFHGDPKAGANSGSSMQSTATVASLKVAYMKLKNDLQLSVSRLSQFRIAFRVLEEHVGGHYRLSNITKEQCREIAAFLPRVPAYATQHFKGMRLADAVAVYELKHGKSAGRFAEASKHLNIITQAIQFAVNEDWIATNPFKGIAVPAGGVKKKKHEEKDHKYQSFSLDDLKKIFEAPLFVGCKDDMHGFSKPGRNRPRRHRFWAPIIALHTGMRMNEILQLEKGDLRKEGEVWYLAVTDEEEISYDPKTFEKRVKNKNAVRDIPLHPFLIEIGFVSWVDTLKPGRIFPEALQGATEKPSNLFSKRTRTFLKSVNVWVARRKVFHSFRGTFNDALRDADVPRELREAINGWQEQQSMDRQYGRGHKVKRLYDEIKKFGYSVPELNDLLEKQ